MRLQYNDKSVWEMQISCKPCCRMAEDVLVLRSVGKTNNRICHVNTISVQFRFRCRSLFGLTTTLHHNSNMSEMRSGFNFGSFVHGEIIPQGPCPSCYQVTAKKENCLKDFDSLCYATNLSFICDRALCAVYLS